MITLKIKIGNFFYSHSRSIQNTAHHIQSKKDGVISEGNDVGNWIELPKRERKANYDTYFSDEEEVSFDDDDNENLDLTYR